MTARDSDMKQCKIPLWRKFKIWNYNGLFCSLTFEVHVISDVYIYSNYICYVHHTPQKSYTLFGHSNWTKFPVTVVIDYCDVKSYEDFQLTLMSMDVS